MGFASQDAWRRHPAVSGHWKGLRPYPGLLLSLGIFSVYLVLDTAWQQLTYVPKTGKKFKFTKEGVGEVPELQGKLEG